MATFFSHDFTASGAADGTDLSAVKPDTGTSWARHGNSAGALLFTGGRVRAASNPPYSFYAAIPTIAPASADYYAEVTFFVVSNHDYVGVVVGLESQTTGFQARYQCRYSAGGGAVELRQFQSDGGAFLMQSAATGTPAVGSTHTLRLTRTLSGADVVLTATLDGVDLFTFTAVNPGAPFTDVGMPGLMSQARSATLGPHATSFTAADVVVSQPPDVALTSPPGATLGPIPAGTIIILRATATDEADGDISGSISWTSSNTDDGTSGDLGTGASITLDTTGWADGTRTITASATDSASQTGTDSFTLTIGTASTGTTGRREPMFISGKYGAGLTVPAAILYDVSEAAFTGTLAAGDVLVSKDGGAKAAITTLPTKNANGTSWTVQLSAAETAAKSVEVFYGSGSAVPFLAIVTFGDPAAWDTSYDVVVGSDGRAEANLMKINDQALTGAGPIDLA